MSTINVSSASELTNALKNLQPGTEIKIAPGEYHVERIHRIDDSGTASQPIIITGSGIGQTKFFPKNGKVFRVFGNHVHFSHMTVSGGVPFAVLGNHIRCDYVEFRDAATGQIISGNGYRGYNCVYNNNQKAAMEINGGFIYRPTWGEREPIRIKQALGLLPNASDEQNAAQRAKWTPEQIAEMEAIWDRRDIDCYLKHCFFAENAYNKSEQNPDGWRYGQSMYGGSPKCVPNISGLTMEECFVYDSAFSGYWVDDGSKGTNIFKNCYVVGAKHGAHLELGPASGMTNIVEDCTFWNVHQGVFNSASGTNYFRNNIFGSYKWGFVNHGIKGNRVGRKVVGHFENNHIYLFSSNVTNLGTTTFEEPKAHAIWYVGPNANGSTRKGNVYYTTPDFPELKIAEVSNEGYSVANLGNLHEGEKVEHIDQIPALMIPHWWKELPKFKTLFTYDGVYEYKDEIIIDPVTPSTVPDVVVFTDLSEDTDPDDRVSMAALLLTMHGRLSLKGVVVGCHKKAIDSNKLYEYSDPLVMFNQTLGKAYEEEKKNLNGEEIPSAYLADTYRVGFANFNGNATTVEAIANLIKGYSQANPLYLASWGTLGELALLAKYIKENSPEDLAKFVIISHATYPVDLNNFRQDRQGGEYLKGLVANDEIRFVELGFAGKTIDDRKSSTGEMSPEVKKSKIGAYLQEKWIETSLEQPGRPDFSDFATIVALAFPELNFGLQSDFWANIKNDGTSNKAEFEAVFGDQKKALYEIVEKAAELAATIDDDGIDDAKIKGLISDVVSQLTLLVEKLQKIAAVF